MPLPPGNLSSLSITESDLEARMPLLSRFRDPRTADWTAQIAAGQIDALEAFRLGKNEDPQYVVPVSADAWKRVLVFFTLTLIFKGIPGEEARAIEDKWAGEGDKALQNLLYRVDRDESGAIEDVVEEGVRAFRDVVLTR